MLTLLMAQIMKPLNNIRVIDVTRLLPGAYCTLILKDLGAEVIKIEDPERGDYMRYMPPFLKNGVSAPFAIVNRGKKSVVLNLKEKEVIYNFKKIVRSADILIEGFRPGVMKKLGLDYESLKKEKKDLIYCSLSGYGQTGPYKDLASHDLNYLSLSGILHPPLDAKSSPHIPPTQFADICGGSLMAALSLLAALIQRNQSGEGCYIDASILDGTLALMILPFAQLQGSKEPFLEWDAGLRGSYPNYAIYETKDGRYVGFAAVEKKFWSEFCRKVKREELIEKLPEYMNLRDVPYGDLKLIKKELEKIFKSKTFDEWNEFFKNSDVCLTPLQNKKETFESSYVKERRLFVESEEEFSYLRTPFTPFSLNKEDLKIPALGEHTKEIIAAFLGK